MDKYIKLWRQSIKSDEQSSQNLHSEENRLQSESENPSSNRNLIPISDSVSVASVSDVLFSKIITMDKYIKLWRQSIKSDEQSSQNLHSEENRLQSESENPSSNRNLIPISDSVSVASVSDVCSLPASNTESEF
ncbi:hypothetical protein Bhyg_12250 [Pseudolycoriella hygida]|uniref:Uncharacterized protein n=1 Tax=Pseudolycoriella hygida TaxID=35572 RepID=A0A9Q0MYH6_9DIPT|nr:hypothetical protein Bhyg_12250 [Pseudolycoriella hygida]